MNRRLMPLSRHPTDPTALSRHHTDPTALSRHPTDPTALSRHPTDPTALSRHPTDPTALSRPSTSLGGGGRCLRPPIPATGLARPTSRPVDQWSAAVMESCGSGRLRPLAYSTGGHCGGDETCANNTLKGADGCAGKRDLEDVCVLFVLFVKWGFRAHRLHRSFRAQPGSRSGSARKGKEWNKTTEVEKVYMWLCILSKLLPETELAYSRLKKLTGSPRCHLIALHPPSSTSEHKNPPSHCGTSSIQEHRACCRSLEALTDTPRGHLRPRLTPSTV